MKTNNFKKLVSIAFALIITATTVVSASAATYFEENGFKYLPMDKFNCKIYGYSDTKADVVVPNKLSSYTVLEVADYAFVNNKNIETVSFSNAKAIDVIGEFAFSGCTQLKSIDIPMTLDKIGYGAFMGCVSLSDITIRSNISEIKEQTFEDCVSLTEFTVPDSVSKISDFAFADCSSLEKVVIPKSVNSISAKAFKNCNNLTIYGYTKSYAESFANENSINFVALDKKITLGDVNLDGVVDVNDVTLIQLFIAGDNNSITDEDAVKAADYNKDSNIDVTDVTDIQIYIASKTNI